MILPCPYEEGDKISLYNLEHYGALFTDLNATFPLITHSRKSRRSDHPTASASLQKEKKLEVHDVGCYKVSIATSITDLQKVDESIFTLPKNIEEIMTKYYKSGFAFVLFAF
jgi:hypothetical protein